MKSEDYLGKEVVGYDLGGEGLSVGVEFSAGVDGGVDAGVDVVADDGAEFATSGIDELPLMHGAVGFSIVAEIGGDGAGTEVDFVSDNGVADVREVADGGVGEDEGVFDFDGLTDVAVGTDGCVAADVAVGADFAVFADDGVALNEDTREDSRALADVDDAFDVGGGVNFAVDFADGEVAYVVFVGFEKIPRVLDEERTGSGIRVAVGFAIFPSKGLGLVIDESCGGAALKCAKIYGTKPRVGVAVDFCWPWVLVQGDIADGEMLRGCGEEFAHF